MTTVSAAIGSREKGSASGRLPGVERVLITAHAVGTLRRRMLLSVTCTMMYKPPQATEASSFRAAVASMLL